MSDELELEVDVSLDDIVGVDVPGKTHSALPLVTPSMSGACLPTTVDFRGELEITRDAKPLFDFSGSTLTIPQQVYIVAYATRGTKTGACKVAGVPFSAVSRWMEDESFVEALNNAAEIVRDSLEEELLRRAMDGSDKLLLEAVKAMKPEKYNKKQSDVNINGTMVHTFADLAKMAVGSGSTPVVEATYSEEDEDA